MTEINHDERNLEQRLRKHYQQRFAPPQAPSSIWARLQPELVNQGTRSPDLSQDSEEMLAQADLSGAERQGAFTQSQQEKDDLAAGEESFEQANGYLSRSARNRWPISRRFRRTFEIAIAALVIASLTFGWFAVTKWRSTQGSGPALYTYASQPGEYVYDYNWTPDGKYFTFAILTQTTNHYRYMVLDVAAGKARQTLSIALPSSLTGKIILDSADGRYALIRTTGASEQTWDLKLANVLTGQTKLIYQATYQGPGASGVPAVAFSEDCKYVAFIAADQRIHVWDIVAGKTIQITDTLTTSNITGSQWFAWSLDGKRIMTKSDEVVSGKMSRLQVWSVQTGHKLLNIVETPTMSLFYWAPEYGNLGGLSLDGTRILTYNKQTGVMVERESLTLKVLHSFSVRVTRSANEDASVVPLWLANGARFFMQKDQNVTIWDGSTGKLISTISMLRSEGRDLLPSTPGGRYIAIWKGGNRVEVWDTVTGAKVRTIESTINSRVGIAWSADGRYLDLNNSQNSWQVYNALTGRLLVTYQGYNVVPSPGGRYIAAQTITPLQRIVQILRVS